MVKSFKLLFDRQARYIVAAATLLLASVVPALVSAAQVTERSIALSSSSANADNVTYQVNFTSVGAAGAFVVDFCSNTPLLSETCNAPTGFDVTDAASSTVGFTDVADLDTNTLRVTGTIAAATAISVNITGIDNPTNAGPLYARIVTYDDATDANGYTSANPDAVGVHVDDGGVAMSITPTIGVSAAVLESMIFCVAGEVIDDAGCSGAPYAAPTLQLGETVGTVKALDSSAVSTGDIYTQISTNASGGAIVSLKNNVSCGGMKRVEASVCDIAAALQTNITAGQAKFGLVANAFTDNDVTLGANGTYQIKSGTGYHASNYALNYLANNSSGVTSPYGDPLLDTGDDPVNNKVMKLTFGASVSNQTPAGSYSADLSLIATGKF